MLFYSYRNWDRLKMYQLKHTSHLSLCLPGGGGQNQQVVIEFIVWMQMDRNYRIAND